MRSPTIVFWAGLLLVVLQAQSGAAATARMATEDDGTPAAVQIFADGSSAAPESATAREESGVPSSAGQQSKAPTQTPKASKPKPSPDSDRPPIEGSMVGYIDNAIVGSEIRIRFDAGFGTNAPDRAEYFYAQCGCEGGTSRGPKPGIATNLNFQQLYMRGEYAPLKRLSFFVELPFRWLQPLSFANNAPGFANQAGLADMQAGVKFAVIASHQRFLTLQLVGQFPSGDSTRGLGTAHYSFAPSLLFFQKIGDRIGFEAQAGDSHPTGGDTPGFAGDVFTYGIGPSYELYRGETVRITPVLELVGWRVIEGMETNPALIGIVKPPVQSADGINIVNMKIGARTSIGNHNSIYVGFGEALTHDIWYKHILRIEYRYTF
jgi:hypothetical protein